MTHNDKVRYTILAQKFSAMAEQGDSCSSMEDLAQGGRDWELRRKHKAKRVKVVKESEEKLKVIVWFECGQE